MNSSSRLREVLGTHLPVLARAEIARRVPPLYGALKIKPTYAVLGPTDNCNMRFIMCNQWRERNQDALDTDQWRDVIRQLADLGVKTVAFIGGEPMLRRDIYELVRAASDAGMSTWMISSAYLLDQKKIDKLIDAGLENISLSLDGIEEDYEKIRGMKWERVGAAARLMAKAHHEGRINAIIGFVVMRDTINHLEHLYEFGRELGLPVKINFIDNTPYFFKVDENQRETQDTNWVGPSQRKALLSLLEYAVKAKTKHPESVVSSFADLDYGADYFDEPLQKNLHCVASQLRIMLNSHGVVYGGCWSMQPFGNVLEKPLAEIIYSDDYVNAHRAMFYKDCPGCSCDYQNNVTYSMPKQMKNVMFKMFPKSRRRIYTDPDPATAKPDVSLA